MNTNLDIEAILFMLILHLKEEKNKEYSNMECEKNIAYIFSNQEEFNNYFTVNSISPINNEILDLCKMKTTKKGSIIALKGLCDHTITKNNEIINKSLTKTLKRYNKEVI